MIDQDHINDILHFTCDMLIILILTLKDIVEYVKDLFFRKQHRVYSKKTAFITGANGGVGKELCTKLVQLDCNLICLEHPNCKESMEKFRQNTLLKLNPNVNISTYYVDLSDIKSVEEYSTIFFSDCEIHFSFFNAAINYEKDFIDVDTERFMHVLRVNFVSNMILMKFIMRQMIKNKSGDIVAISSILSEHGIGNEVAYSASKAAISSLIESGASYCDLNRYNFIRFHTIFPSKIDTSLFSQLVLSKYSKYIFPLLKPEYVAQKTIEAVTYNYREVYLPYFMFKVFIIVREFIPPKSLLRLLRYLYQPTSVVSSGKEKKQ